MARTGRGSGLALALLLAYEAVQVSASSCTANTLAPLVDNFRDPQVAVPGGLSAPTRVLYRTPDASASCEQPVTPACKSTTCKTEPATENKRIIDTSTMIHWSYADQENWDSYLPVNRPVPFPNECFAPNSPGTYPGESPINITPGELISTPIPQIKVSGFDTSRGGLYFKNNGHTVQVDVCGFNAADCTARANFGMWPRTMRGIDVSGMGTCVTPVDTSIQGTCYQPRKQAAATACDTEETTRAATDPGPLAVNKQCNAGTTLATSPLPTTGTYLAYAPSTKTITMDAPITLKAGQTVSGNGIAPGTKVASDTTTAEVVIDTTITDTITGDLTFGITEAQCKAVVDCDGDSSNGNGQCVWVPDNNPVPTAPDTAPLNERMENLAIATSETVSAYATSTKTITLNGAVTLKAGQTVSGTGIAPGTKVASDTTTTEVVIDTTTTDTITGDLTFGITETQCKAVVDCDGDSSNGNGQCVWVPDNNPVPTAPDTAPLNERMENLAIATSETVSAYATTTKTITLNGAVTLKAGQTVFGPGIAVGTTVASDTTTTEVVIDTTATGAVTAGDTITFGLTTKDTCEAVSNCNTDGKGACVWVPTEDEYFLLQIHLHWGSDNTKGSEHQVCDNPRSAEMHMVFANTRGVAADRNDPDSGARFAVLGTMIQGGAAADNTALAPIFDAVAPLAPIPGMGNPGTNALVFADMLPTDYDTKFYTYAGSLTTPPCLQQVSWFLFDNFVEVSDAQMEKLRSALFMAPTSRQWHNGFRALLFPFTAIAIGTATEHFLTHAGHGLGIPYTVAVLVEGGIFDWLVDWASGLGVFSNTGLPRINAPWQETFEPFAPLWTNSMKLSIDMWANIDGHTLLFGFLPALLFGDTMILNTHIFRKCFWQCVLLACPGVLMGTFAMGFAAYYLLPYKWPLYLCLAFGSITSATDPVAVVALLKSVGASPKLTMTIMGESLMNDGTAIVLFNLFWCLYNDNPSLGNGNLIISYDTPAKIILYFLRMAIGGPILGIIIGWLGCKWMGLANHKYSHSDVTIQTSITVCVAYLAFFIGESEIVVSGVLCTVSAALVMADRAWPIVINHDSMENVWHALEYFGNTLLFFLAGVISSRAIRGYNDQKSAQVVFKMNDLMWVFIFFLIMLLVRSIMTMIFYPYLAKLGYGTSPKDAAFMVWAGLRGAVGLALALVVSQSGGDQRHGKQVLFMVAGLAFLTLIINGTTSGPLLKYWRMLGIPEVKQQMLIRVRDKIVENSEKEYNKMCIDQNHDAEDALEFITSLRHLKGAPSARPVSLRVQHALKMSGHAVKLQSQVTPEMRAQLPAPLQEMLGSEVFSQSCMSSFEDLDHNKNGLLEPHELAPVIVDMMAGIDHSGPPMTLKACLDFVGLVFDQNGDGTIDRNEFFYLIEFVVACNYIESLKAAAASGGGTIETSALPSDLKNVMSEVQKEVHPQGAAAETTSNPMLGQAGSLQQESATGGGTHSPGGTILRPASGDHLSAMAGNAPPTDLPPIDIHGHAHTRSKNNSMHKWSLAELEEAQRRVGPPEKEHLQTLRETFYHIVRQEYWKMIDEGRIPAKSPAVSILLDSVDESLDDLIKPLHDWEFVELQIAETHGKLGTWIQWVLEKIDVLLPESVDCDNKLNYIQKYQMYTTLFYVTDAYVGAQIMAQHKLSEFFGQSRLGDSFAVGQAQEDPQNIIPSSPEEIAVCLESTLNVADAQRQLDGMNEVMIELIKTNVIADNLLDLEYNFVVKLIRQGVITTTDAEEIFHEIVRNHKAVATARRRQAITIAEAQIHADRGLAMDQILDKHSERSLKDSGAQSVSSGNMAKLLSDSSMFKSSAASRSQYEENKGAVMTPTSSAQRKAVNSHERTQLAAAKAGEEFRAAMGAGGGGGGRRSPSPNGQGAPNQRFSGADVGDIELGAPSF